MSKQEISLFDQKTFRAIVVQGTGLTLATMLGSLALIHGRDASGFQWAWNGWSVALFIGGFAFMRNFWQSVFQSAASGLHADKAKVVFRVFALAALGLGSFLYPVRFLASENYFQIARGLFTAFVFLGLVGVMLYKVGHGLFANELKDGQSS